MGKRTVVLINSNEMRPPVAPLALDYIGERLQAGGFDVRLADLTFAEDANGEIARALTDVEPVAVGVSFRNTDDCYPASCAWFVPRLREIVDVIHGATSAPVVLGGCGFNVFPIPVTEHAGADLAIAGDGEEAFLRLAERLARGEAYRDLPGLVYRDDDGQLMLNPPRYDNAKLDVPTARDLVDNARYLREGAMGNIETKRGCPMKCIYCADPVAKGNAARCRPPAQVADEIESLLRQGVDVLHLCDGEFNIPPRHALAVCGEMIRRGLGERVRWYCYASVRPFPMELAAAMRQAGCVGINFGVDSGCDRMLNILGRRYRRDHIRETVEHCQGAGITVMLDLLLGGPGEDEASVRETIDFIKSVNPVRAGAATGVRVYPGTRLAAMISHQGLMKDNPNLYGNVEDNDDLLRPVFYIDRRLGEDAGGFVCDLIDGDERFFPPPRIKDATNYNYNDNTVLEEAIAAGHRGAFWDILRRLAEQG